MNLLDLDLTKANSMLEKASKIALIGSGGNMAICQHMASDIYRHTGKYCFAPSDVMMSSLGSDEDWKDPWLEYACECADLVIAIACRSKSKLVTALEDIEYAVPTLLFAPQKHRTIETVVIPVETYHEFEVNAMWSIYMMMEQLGYDLPKLPQV